jgi:hypothetical protein
MSSHFNTPQIVPPSSLENTNESTTESTTESITESKTDFVDKLVNVTGNELANLIFLKSFASKCPDTDTNMVGAAPTMTQQTLQTLTNEYWILNDQYYTKLDNNKKKIYTDYILQEQDLFDIYITARSRYFKAYLILENTSNNKQFWYNTMKSCHTDLITSISISNEATKLISSKYR